MKWIGQHIWGFISRFRNDVYLEDVSTGTIASGGNLGLDSNNKIVKATESSGGISHDGSTANGVLTFKDSDEATVESNLTFDGSTLTLTGDITASGDTFTFQSANADDPQFIIKNTTANNQAARLQMRKDRGAAMVDNDRIGEIDFIGEDASENTQQYGKILTQAQETAHGTETGKMIFQVAEFDGDLGNGLKIVGQDSNGVINVDTGLGATSVTTVAGTLTMGSTATINNSGVIQVAAQTVIDHDQLANFAANEHFTQANITTVGTIGTGVWQGTAIASAYIADDAVTFAKASGVTPNVFGSIIKLIPSDFMANDDGGNTKFGVGYVESAGTLYGMRPGNNAVELFAFVSIPEGMKATHVDIFDKNDVGVVVYEAQINATTMTSKGTGNCNTTIDITDVNATATNFLAIQVTTTSVNDKVFGGQVTIAAQ